MASFSVSCPKNSALFTGSQPGPNQNHQQPHCSVSFQSNSQALLAGSSLRLTGSKHNQSGVCKVSQLNEVAIKSSNSAPIPETKVEEPEKTSVAETTVPDASAISAFMTQAADLIKLVDSRDIMELHLKQLDCELIIRKKEALQPQEVAAPVYMMQPPPAHSQLPQQVGAPAPAAPSPPPASAPAPTSPPKAKSSHPPLKCPMAGTFYRSPAPGAAAFVKVGDKVQKGQVVCIIEAMKLMNEIEADQSGTLTEILVDDGKPVSLDTPLFVIEP